ncbi:hypothetical protein LTR93_011775 [Exophiala xenobiotica]|nr:hypothetical protein LTR93_011775 [Exophiala xenobiotica]
MFPPSDFAPRNKERNDLQVLATKPPACVDTRHQLTQQKVILFAAFGSLFSGYSLNIITATLGQPTFYSSLNLVPSPTLRDYNHTTAIIGAANGLLFAGGFAGGYFGTFMAGWCGDKIGRVKGFRVAAVVGIVGGALQRANVNQAMALGRMLFLDAAIHITADAIAPLDQYLVARFITGFATGHTVAAMPIYYVEVAPPHSRGLMSGAHGVFINMGYAVATWLGFACFHASETSFAWRFPNAVLINWCLSLLVGSFFIPESPRWLVSNDHHDRALNVLCKLHRDKRDPDNSVAHQELELIKRQVDADRMASQQGVWKQLFRQKTYRKRIVLAAMVLLGGQNLGILVINNYSALLYQSLSFSASEALIFAACYNTWATLSNMVGAVISARVGRRRVMVLPLLIARYSETFSRTYAAVAIVFLFLYALSYSCIDTSQFSVAAEIFPSHLRSRGTSFAISLLFLADTLWLELGATAMQTIGWKYYLVFVSLGVVHTVYLFFKLPGTSDLALEEIDALFGKAPKGHIEDETSRRAL